MEEKRSEFLGIPGIAWAAVGGLLLLMAIVWFYVTDSSPLSFF